MAKNLIAAENKIGAYISKLRCNLCFCCFKVNLFMHKTGNFARLRKVQIMSHTMHKVLKLMTLTLCQTPLPVRNYSSDR